MAAAVAFWGIRDSPTCPPMYVVEYREDRQVPDAEHTAVAIRTPVSMTGVGGAATPGQ